MQSLAILLAFTAAMFVQLGSPSTPPGFSPSVDKLLEVKYGDLSLTPGTQLGIDIPTAAPSINVRVDPDGSLYFVAMVDLDAPTPQNPNMSQFLHWLESYVTRSDGDPGALAASGSGAIAPYVAPQPPPSSDPHRYVLLLFGQPTDWFIPDAWKRYSAENSTDGQPATRAHFDVGAFAADANLHLVATNYFYCGNASDEAVPATGTVAGGSVSVPVTSPATGAPSSVTTSNAAATSGPAGETGTDLGNAVPSSTTPSSPTQTGTAPGRGLGKWAWAVGMGAVVMALGIGL